MTEAILVTPVVIAITLGLIQVLWILLATVMFQYAALKAAYSGALTGLDSVQMQLEFQRKIAALPGSGVSSNSISFPVSMRLISPSPEQLKELAVYSGRHGAGGHEELALEHFAVALNQLDAENRQEFIRLRELVIEASWCFELRVPLAGPLIARASHGGAAYRPCFTANGYPMIRLTQTFVVPLRSNLPLASDRVVKLVTSR